MGVFLGFIGADHAMQSIVDCDYRPSELVVGSFLIDCNQLWITHDRIPQRTAFSHFHPILTRPSDNDVNGHIAGATVHGFFETAIQAFLVEQAEVDLRDGELAAFVVSSAADFFALPGFPTYSKWAWG